MKSDPKGISDQKPSPGTGQSRLHRILVVEDDPDVRRLNAGVLKESGYHVEVAKDGLVAWEAMQRAQFDLVLTDNHMNRLSGVGLVLKIKAAHMETPVIMVSGSRPETQIPLQGFLLKPYNVDELLNMVGSVLI